MWLMRSSLFWQKLNAVFWISHINFYIEHCFCFILLLLFIKLLIDLALFIRKKCALRLIFTIITPGNFFVQSNLDPNIERSLRWLFSILEFFRIFLFILNLLVIIRAWLVALSSIHENSLPLKIKGQTSSVNIPVLICKVNWYYSYYQMFRFIKIVNSDFEANYFKRIKRVSTYNFGEDKFRLLVQLSDLVDFIVSKVVFEIE